jgi:type VI protein secretion system component Hcp
MTLRLCWLERVEENAMTNIVKKWVMRLSGIDRYVPKGDNVKDEFEILSFNHGVYAQNLPDGSRQVQVQDINVMRASDALTPVLFKICMSGEILDSVIIELRTVQDERETFVMRYELLKARIGAVSPGGSPQGQDPALVESLMLSYERLRMHVHNSHDKSTVDIVPPKP